MNKSEAATIIKDVFERSFEKERFLLFAKNLLQRMDYSKTLPKISGAYIKDKFREYVNSYERLGTYTDPEGKKIDVLIVYLQKETSLERARAAQRNFVAEYLKGRGEKDAGLIAFVSPDVADWRFSFVKMEYRLEKTEKGKIKATEEFTPARRYSFLVGAQENSHTAQSRLWPLLLDDKHAPLISELEDAFSVEKVTKEFFEKYRALFLDVCDALDKIVGEQSKIKAEFELRGVETADFAKKLLGQIVFLYFLQKKGWFGVERDADWGTGPKDFLRKLFKKELSDYRNFFNDILEPLFYEALARERDSNFYGKFNCNIPFLNGGLFDPINNYDWVHTDILLANELFSNNFKTPEGDTGTGILDVFDRYNFTVKEDEPLEKEVAIDPEMLGKVFENLLEVKDRKSKGTYYTPREIVHYMCQQSLIYYLFSPCPSDPSPCHSPLICHSRESGNPSFSSLSSHSVIASEAKQSLSSPSPLPLNGKGGLPFVALAKEGGGGFSSFPNHSPLPTKEEIETFIKYGESALEHDARVEAKGKETDAYPFKLPPSIREHAAFLDAKLADIKVCDPAVGSGAFLVGMMSEIVRARKVLSTYLSSSLHNPSVIPASSFVIPAKAGIHLPPHPERAVSLRAKRSNLIFPLNLLPLTANRSPYEFKRHAIHDSLYGVDIDPSAVEIAKLRLWLSLVVDEEDIKNIKPLPNLDYKIMQGNSLLEEYEGIKLFDEKFILGDEPEKEQRVWLEARQTKLQQEYISLHSAGKLTVTEKARLDNELQQLKKALDKIESGKAAPAGPTLFTEMNEAHRKVEALQKLHLEFLESSQKSRKDDIRKQIDTLEWELIESTLKEEGKSSALKTLAQYRQANIKPFFLWKLHFSEVFRPRASSPFAKAEPTPPFTPFEKGGPGGFDIVIANPPYIKEDVNRAAFENLKKSECYQGKMDIWYLFGAKGLTLSRGHGIVTFIATNNWISNDGASKFRDKVLRDGRLLEYIDFGNHKIFSAGIQTMVFLISKEQEPANYTVNYGKLTNDNADNSTILHFLNNPYQITAPDFFKYQFVFKRADYEGQYINFVPPIMQQILDKIKKDDAFYLRDDEIFSGIDVMQDFVTKKHLEKLGAVIKKGDGIFVLRDREKKNIAWNQTERNIIKPYFTTQEINRYRAINGNQYWVVYSSAEINNKINEYPNIKKHLDRFQTVITSVNKPYGLHRTREESIFLGKKILSVRKCEQPSFSLVDFPCYVSRAFLIIKTERLNLKYLLAILNSRLAHFWLLHKGKLQGNLLQIDKIPLKNIPVAVLSKEQQKTIIALADKILDIKSKDSDANTADLENQIDQLVYKLYNLTPSEIAIVEGSLK